MLSNIPVDAMWSKMSNVTSLLPRRMVSLLGCAVLLFINTMTAYGGLVPEENSSSAVPVPDEAPWQFVRKLGTSYSGPYFDDNHPTNVNAQLGGHAFLPCTVKRRGTRLVSWVRKTDGALVSVDRDVFIGDGRFSSAYDAITDTWTLQIRGVRMQDAGFFECQVSSEPKTAIVVRLHIVVPKVKIKGAPDIYVMGGSPVELQCVITNVIEEPPFIFWYHEGERVPDYENTRPQPYLHESQSRRALRTDQVAAGELAVPVPYIYRSERRNFRNGDADRRVAMFGDGQGNEDEDDDDEGGILADRSENINRPLLNDTQRRESMMENQGGQGLSKSSALIASIPFKSFNILRLEANIIVSVMSISSVTLDDAGIYECSPSNLPIASVMLHVLNGEHPAAIQESKNASTASNRAAGHVGYPHWSQVCSCCSCDLTTERQHTAKLDSRQFLILHAQLVLKSQNYEFSNFVGFLIHSSWAKTRARCLQIMETQLSLFISADEHLKEAVRTYLSSPETGDVSDLRDTLSRIRMSLKTEASPQFTVLGQTSSTEVIWCRLPNLLDELVTLLKETNDGEVIKEGLSLLKALANYRKDGVFVRTFQACQGLLLLLDLLKRKWDDGSISALLFNLLKIVACHRCSCKILGREGIVDLFQGELIPRAEANAIALKAALEALTYVLKLKVNSTKAAQGGLVQTLLSLLSRHSARKERNRLKLCKYTVSCLSSISKQAPGLAVLRNRESLETLHRFCTSCPDTEANDGILYKAGGIIIRCAGKQELPITIKGPLQFTLPVPEEGLHSVAIYSRESTPLSWTVSESDNDASEEAGAGELGEDDKENADGKRVPKQKRHRARRNASDVESHYHELNDLSVFAPFFGLPSSSSSRDLLDAQGDPSDFRSQIMAELSSVLKQPSHYAAKTEVNKENVSTRDLDLDQLMALTAKWDRKKIYEHVANRVHHILPFVKLAYPDWVGAQGEDQDQFLHKKDRKVCRSIWLRNLQQALHPAVVPTAKPLRELVYDLDELLTGSPALKWLNNDDGNLLGKREPVNHLRFESRFESGNLRKVFQVGPREYDFILNPDVNSSHRQLWFYFQVRNMQAHLPYTFNILNNEKQNSLFNEGMKPVMFSVTQAFIKQRHTWTRAGTDICYFRNVYHNPASTSGKNYMTATFSVTFPYSYDVVYMAYHYPYTYSQLLTDVCLWKRDKPDLTVKTLCSTLLKNPVPVLRTSGADPAVAKLVILTGRVHPGESNSSWVMKGSVDALIRNFNGNKHTFLIIPMLNIDGVINGCYRCDLTDEDLNRCWLNPSPLIHPTIYHSKGLVEYACKVLRNPPIVFCDYHGHSRHKNIFLYGCSAARSWKMSDANCSQNVEEIVELAQAMHDNCQAFCKDYCSFVIEEERESTARVALWRNLGIQRSYTLEASLAGADRGEHQGRHLTTHHYEEAGRAFVMAIMSLK